MTPEESAVSNLNTEMQSQDSVPAPPALGGRIVNEDVHEFAAAQLAEAWSMEIDRRLLIYANGKSAVDADDSLARVKMALESQRALK